MYSCKYQGVQRIFISKRINIYIYLNWKSSISYVQFIYKLIEGEFAMNEKNNNFKSKI